jgi:hypothetical protein
MTSPGFEPGPPRWEAGDYPPELWRGRPLIFLSVPSTGYGLDDRGVGIRVPVGSKVFSSPLRPDRL